jgi:hypothetical protein
MTGCIVQIWFEPETEGAPRLARFEMIETEFPDFASFCECVDADRLIGGAILWTRPAGRFAKEITHRQPCAFRGSAVLRCQLPRLSFVEGCDA